MPMCMAVRQSELLRTRSRPKKYSSMRVPMRESFVVVSLHRRKHNGISVAAQLRAVTFGSWKHIMMRNVQCSPYSRSIFGNLALSQK